MSHQKAQEIPNRILQVERIVITGLGITLLLIIIGIYILVQAFYIGISKQLTKIQFIATLESIDSVKESPCLIFSVQNIGNAPIRVEEVEIVDLQTKKISHFTFLSEGKDCVSDRGETRLQPDERSYFSAGVKSLRKTGTEGEAYVTACLLVYNPPLCAGTKAKVLGP